MVTGSDKYVTQLNEDKRYVFLAIYLPSVPRSKGCILLWRTEGIPQISSPIDIVIFDSSCNTLHFDVHGLQQWMHI
jgi:hypothetical protein